MTDGAGVRVAPSARPPLGDRADGGAPASVTGGRAVVAALAEHGVEVVFGIPGTHNLEIYRHLPGSGIRVVTPRHEQGAGYAADGYARVTGRPGVVLTTTGPALLNAATAAGVAYADSVPVLLVSPGMPRSHVPGSGELHEVKDQSGAMAAICASSHRVRSVAEIHRVVDDFMAEVRDGRPRPVHLEVPLDVLETPARPAPRLGVARPPRPAPSDDAVRRAAATLVGARSPVIIAGGGARGAAADLVVLAELLGAPVLTTANGKGTVPEHHPLSVGAVLHLAATRELLAAADVVLAVGTELSTTDFWAGPPELPGSLVRVDVDVDQTRRPVIPTHPLVGDAGEVVGRLLAAARELTARASSAGRPSGGGPSGGGRNYVPRTIDTLPRPFHDPRVSAIKEESVRAAARWDHVVPALRRALPDDAVLVGDTSMACYHGALAEFRVPGPGSFLVPTGFATLGYALPAAIGASVGAPGRAVAALTGDGAFQFSLTELATAVEMGLPLPVVVVDNGGYGVLREEMRERGITPTGVDLRGPDFVALAGAYGARGVAATTAPEVERAVREALEADVPTVVVVPEKVA
ncbi:acetolactate synthase-1/2/3 large subunit [Streptoalloteichus tenebrarius]|uniref:Acetolactate synthase-1/2/3 large subunit n=1 Tax=Streptoalloteichus tenebrarius (strain ATCC 17920 / DSM 40477 / JCM 4838 / CBS 697.72 / NBRC 16177 / NCIMB 11028 / NRRL B-12390 / A12253. 1 / ISP 5477) TaxID=1933 RepID=A0ABT1HU45_STRSD|nr:5-guanidino-2-oxopentanoate decarboxylase [Streptoalloteichus tenebrarius]MCP2259045.1 acetolactate synthase-1/2/3 large subunit [Streptoalloteichus tenebrarius]BFE99629.1 5-guanidino-2-oxopentanoate decarboxylase [Streptoalloteichus tenebrarius]